MIHTNVILDVKKAYMIGCMQLFSVQRQFRCDKCERQQSVNDFKSYRFGNQWAALSYCSKVNVQVGVIVKKANHRSLPHPENESQRSVNDVWHCVMKHPVGCAGTVSHNRTVGRLSIQQWW